jgi:hypothetical protein
MFARTPGFGRTSTRVSRPSTFHVRPTPAYEIRPPSHQVVSCDFVMRIARSSPSVYVPAINHRDDKK